MARGRAWLAGAVASTLAVTGMTAVSATPAAAEAGNTTMTCTMVPGTPQEDSRFDCVISDPDGIRTIGYHVTPEGGYKGTDGVWGEYCDTELETTSTEYTFYPALRTKFFITDCDQPRNHATFVVRADGTVREIRNN